MSGKKKYVVLGGAALAAFILLRKKGGGADVELSLKTASIGKGEPVSAQSYRVIAERRSGMEYTPAEGSVGGELKFSAPNGGVFTRNVVQENGQLLVEIARS
jgi:hypothetical protein